MSMMPVQSAGKLAFSSVPTFTNERAFEVRSSNCSTSTLRGLDSCSLHGGICDVRGGYLSLVIGLALSVLLVLTMAALTLTFVTQYSVLKSKSEALNFNPIRTRFEPGFHSVLDPDLDLDLFQVSIQV